MVRLLILVVCFLWSKIIIGQINLVPNSSFEELTGCPESKIGNFDYFTNQPWLLNKENIDILPQKTQAFFEKPKKADSVNVSVSVNDSVNVSDIDIEMYKAFKHLSLSLEDFNKLLETHSKTQIDTILENIENYQKNTNYTSLYLTAKNWLKRDYPNGKVTARAQENHIPLRI